MSKDIRSFFKRQTGTKLKSDVEPVAKKQLKIIISDDDIIPDSPGACEKNIAGKKSKRRRISDDSSDDEVSNKTNTQRSEVNNAKKIAKKLLKEVSATDIFGSGPIKRTPVPKKPDKDKVETEVAIHSDDEFEKTLLQLDETPTIIVNQEQSSQKLTNSLGNQNDIKNKKKHLKEKTKDFTNHEIKINGSHPEKPKHVKTVLHDELSSYKIPKKHKLEAPKSNIINETTYPKDETSAKIVKLSPQKTENQEKKRDFSEFIELESHDESRCETPISRSKKRKCDQSLSESVVSDEERFEKKRLSAQLYQKYLNRTGPNNIGAKEIPEGAPNCLQNLSFVLTGVLNSFEREEIIDAIQKYGGVIKSSVSKKVTHVLAGDDAGPAKLAKANDLGLQIINEDKFLDLIRQNSNANKEASNDKKDKNAKRQKQNKNSLKKVLNEPTNKKIKTELENTDTKTEKVQNGIKEILDFKIDKTLTKGINAISFYKKQVEDLSSSSNDQPTPCSSKHADVPASTSQSSSKDTKSVSSLSSMSSIGSLDTSALMWVDKYKPKNLKQIIGQNGDASIVKKLSNWLLHWYINRTKKLDKPNPWAKKDDGGYYKCALLSGPPGIGKTTTVSLVCAEMDFDKVEFNASDTRSKSLIKDQISELLTTTSLAGYVSRESGKRAVTKKHVLVMDEVDGMAGNEDRGGMQELISLIKLTSVPIICMCNDRNSPKIRSLVNYCYDLRFTRPRVDQIKSAMMSVCFKEGVKITSDVLTQLIVSAKQDVRQTLNLLSMYSAGGEGKVTVKKDVKLGPWEVVRKVFTEEEQKGMSIHDKSDLFFYDYSIAPLFVQENYLQVQPHCDKKEILKRVSQVADSISQGDIVDAKIRGSGAWGLLPVQAICSSVIPGHTMRGHVAGQIQFPAWLGKNSHAKKMQRLAQQIHAHTRLSTSGSKSDIFLDYCYHLRDAIVQTLVRDRADGIPRALQVLQEYRLLREDLDSLSELAMWSGKRDPMLLVDSKVKAAMTRAYNKEAATLPYAQAAVKKVRASAAEDAGGEENLLEGEGDGEAGEDLDSDSDPENDAMIKVRKYSLSIHTDVKRT